MRAKNLYQGGSEMRVNLQRQKGFTLVELAIVIAVAAILIAAIIYGAGALTGEAKTNRTLEFTKALQTAAATCKIKNAQGMMNVNKDTLDVMVRDSLCRTQGQGVPDNRGIIPSGIKNTLPPGLVDYNVSYNTQTGGLSITYTFSDESIAESVKNALQKFYPGASRNGTQVSFHMPL